MGYKFMKLSIPPEPTNIKKQFIKEKSKIEMKIETLSLWFGNRLPSYLWNEGGWAQPLKKEGYNWQGFLKILSLHKKDMIKWSWDTLSWKDFLIKIQKTLKDPVFKTIVAKT
jgi:hypothetical protein